MADASLDDFFAKKDKSRRLKNKGKPGTDQVPRKTEDIGKKVEKSTKKDKEKNVTSGNTQSVISSPTQEQIQEEWNEVNDEEKDYSCLRVQALTIDKEKEEEQLKDQLTQEDGEKAHSTEGPQGPWKKSSTAATDVESPEVEKDEPEEEEVPEASQPETPVVKKYVPPSRRNESSGLPSTLSSISRRPKTVPEMTSELHFPSLSSAIDPSPKGARSQMNDRSFQSVKHGSRFKDDVSQSGVHLDLENKYAALRRTDN